MSDDFTSDVKGLVELQTALEQLSEKTGKTGIRKALQAGAAPVHQGMVTGAPKKTHFLADHFNVKVKLERGELAGTAYIGPQGKMDYPEYMSGAYKIVRVGKNKIKRVGRIAVASVCRFLEFGTSKMKKKPFMVQALMLNGTQATDAIAESLGDTIREAADDAPKGPRA